MVGSVFAHFRAYAIRPYTCSIVFLGIYWVICWFRFRPREGVCDTPLHMFDCILGLIGLLVGFVFAHIRAYAIRPYTCSMMIMAKYG